MVHGKVSQRNFCFKVWRGLSILETPFRCWNYSELFQKLVYHAENSLLNHIVLCNQIKIFKKNKQWKYYFNFLNLVFAACFENIKFLTEKICGILRKNIPVRMNNRVKSQKTLSSTQWGKRAISLCVGSVGGGLLPIIFLTRVLDNFFCVFNSIVHSSRDISLYDLLINLIDVGWK